jgi:hypothetical protein
MEYFKYCVIICIRSLCEKYQLIISVKILVMFKVKRVGCWRVACEYYKFITVKRVGCLLEAGISIEQVMKKLGKRSNHPHQVLGLSPPNQRWVSRRTYLNSENTFLHENVIMKFQSFRLKLMVEIKMPI